MRIHTITTNNPTSMLMEQLEQLVDISFGCLMTVLPVYVRGQLKVMNLPHWPFTLLEKWSLSGAKMTQLYPEAVIASTDPLRLNVF